MNDSINEAVIIATGLCKRFEGFSGKPYVCIAGYLTIGYGTVYKPDGTRVAADHPVIDEKTASQWLVSSLVNTYIPGVLKASPILINYPKALGAIVDFSYNLGVSRYKASTLRKRINEQKWGDAREELRRWTRAGGVVLTGLVRRREEEGKFLFI